MMVCNIDLNREPCDGRLITGRTESVSCEGWKGHDGEHYVEIRWRTNGEQLRALLKTAEQQEAKHD